MSDMKFSIERVDTSSGVAYRIVEDATGCIYAVVFSAVHAEAVCRLADKMGWSSSSSTAQEAD